MIDSFVHANLERLQEAIANRFAACGITDFPLPECIQMARSLPLAHSLPVAAFVMVSEDQKGIGWKLLSPANLEKHGIKKLRPESAEVVLGTADFVFLYCGRFQYPETQVGFLFRTTLEVARSAECEASPFDSGALHQKVTLPDPSEPPKTFLARHMLPVPGYRDYLANRLQLLFAKPDDYVTGGKEPIRADQVGLRPRPPATTCDPRLWTFEVRVRDEVSLAPPYLWAVFYSGGLRGNRSVRNFLAALGSEVEWHEVIKEDEGDFAALQRAGVEFLRKKGIIP